MSLHDAYARVTPFEFLFPHAADARALGEAVTEEAAGRGADIEQPHAFVTMGAVTDFIRRIEGPGAPSGGIHEYGALTFHAIHAIRADTPVYLLATHVARYLVDGRGGDTPEPPAAAAYLQLPQHLFWLRDSDGVPKSVDGIFWTRTGAGVLHTLLATGMRADRTGLVVVPLPEAPMSDAQGWLDVDARGDGNDFSNEMPGAELDGLYLFETAGEVLKLLARFFAYAQAVPTALEPEATPEDRGTDGVDGPEVSMLPYVRVTLEG